MTALAARLLRSLRDSSLLSSGDRLAVALSGGSDSVALLFLLREIAASLDIQVVGLAHLHHGLRGEDADADEAFARALAGRLGLPIHVERVDVGAEAARRRQSVEQAGHEARAAFYARALGALGATRLATGHTMDDQAETFLLRALRGAGRRGLGGIHPVAGRLVRPLLHVGRSTLQRYLEARGEAWRTDATNADVTVPRNRVRHEVVPMLERVWSPRVVATLARNAQVARDEEALLALVSETVIGGSVVLTEGGVRVPLAGLNAWPRALGRRVLHRALAHVSGRTPGRRQVEALWRAAASAPGHRLWVGGALVWREREVLAIEVPPSEARASSRRRARAVNQFEELLSIPGGVTDPATGWRVEAWPVPVPADRMGGDGPLTVVVDATAAGVALRVRYRRRGDRWQPYGAPGSKSLADFFVDRKVPRDERDSVPLVVSADGRIVWAVGHRIGHAFRVTPGTTGVLLLKASRLGGSG
jgi:tRNA(Ile)-lysidine synthase